MGAQSRPLILAVVALAVVLVVAVGLVVAQNDNDAPPATNGDGAAGTANDDTATGNDDAANHNDDANEQREHAQAVVSAHELATQAGFEVLERGGSAADAAVAVAAVLTVVEPWFSSVLGGGTWALYYDAENEEITSLDGVGPTGSNASVEDFAARADDAGIHQAIVPGAWDGWMLWLERYGRLDLGEVLEPAIRIAREGYPVSEPMADWLGRSVIAPGTAEGEIYAPDGSVVQQGDTVFQHDLADTLEALVAAYDDALDDGRSEAIQAARDYFYRGPLAEAIVQFSDTHGGYLTLDDFHGFEAEIVEPISIEYSDEVTVYQNPPNSQGITMLIALNIIKAFDFANTGPDDADALHIQIEAVKLAFADRHYHVGDPERVDVPVDELLSDEHAANQRERIDMGSAMTWPLDDGLDGDEAVRTADGDTTTFHVVDGDGNAAAVTTSLGAQFLVIDGTGIHINNRMRFLSTEDGDPNQVAPGHKVRHTSNPYMALRNGRPYILGGNTGVDTQPQGQVQQFIHVVEFGLTAQEAVGRPRFVSNGFPATTFPYAADNTLEMEEGFPQEVIAELERRGHAVVVGGELFGDANMIVIREDGTTEFGADPRNDASGGGVLEPEDQ